MTVQRFRTLDAMRGVAALVVVLYHSTDLYAPGCGAPTNCGVRFGYLAVDMFFALSGFVLSLSYDDRLAGGMKLTEFMKLRAVRLFPIYWLGTVLGLVVVAWDVRHGFPLASAAKATATAVALLPSPTFHMYPAAYPLNPPAWSLFLELYVGNVLFAAFHRQLTGLRLAALISLSAIGLVAVEIYYGTLNTGYLWSNFAAGVPRVTFAFFLGVALRRIHTRVKVPQLPAGAILLVLAATFFIRLPVQWAVAYELACVCCVFPILIYLGAGAVERRPALGKFLGDASYALYAVHFPLLLILLIVQQRAGWQPGPLLTAGFLLGALGAAALIDWIYDPRARAVMRRIIYPACERRSLTPPSAR